MKEETLNIMAKEKKKQKSNSSKSSKLNMFSLYKSVSKGILVILDSRRILIGPLFTIEIISIFFLLFTLE